MTLNAAENHLALGDAPRGIIPPLAKEILLGTVFFFIALISIFAPAFLNDSYAITVAAGVGLSLCALILLIRPSDLRMENLRKLRLTYMIPLEIIGLSFVLNGVAFGVLAYLVIGFTFCIALPLFYLAGDEGRRMTLFAAVARGLSCAFWVLAIVSVVSGPGYEGRQYSSFLGNPNQLGGILSAIITCMLFLSWKAYKTGKKPLMIFHFSSCMVAFGFCYLTASRTAILAVALQFVAYALLFALSTEKKGSAFWKRLAKACGVAAIAVTISFNAIFVCLTDVKENLTEAFPQAQFDIGYEHVESLTILDTLLFAQDRFSKGLENNEDDAFTSGRMGIWKDFIANITLMGHESESRALESGSRVYDSVNAHNVYIQIAYSAGLLAGLAMIAIAIVACKDLIKALVRLVRNKQLPLHIVFFCFAGCCFLVQALVSDGYMLFRYLAATLFWLALPATKR